MLDLTGKKALITGSSRGIGRAIALCLARQGADIAVNYAGRADAAAEVEREIRGMGRRCVAIKSDLRTETCAEEIWSQVEEAFGMADILVLNASIQYKKPWESITTSDFDHQIYCNLRSSLLLIQRFVPAMRAAGGGRIITIGSVQESKPHPDMLVYSASKAAQTMMMKSLALQLAPEGITVNNMAPGVILTDRNTDALSDPAYLEATKDKIPMRRCGEPDDCAGIIALLCSEEGRYITGQNIFVDGGMSIK